MTSLVTCSMSKLLKYITHPHTTLSITTTMTTSLDHLKQSGTVVVSDSGDFECMLHN